MRKQLYPIIVASMLATTAAAWALDPASANLPVAQETLDRDATRTEAVPRLPSVEPARDQEPRRAL